MKQCQKEAKETDRYRRKVQKRMEGLKLEAIRKKGQGISQDMLGMCAGLRSCLFLISLRCGRFSDGTRCCAWT